MGGRDRHGADAGGGTGDKLALAFIVAEAVIMMLVVPVLMMLMVVMLVVMVMAVVKVIVMLMMTPLCPEVHSPGP